MILLAVYIPETHLEQVKQALFAAGAGRFNNYEQCSWQTKGEGQFKPINGATPYLGEINQVEKVCEYKVEVICGEQDIPNIIPAMLAAHPYEEVAYHLIQLAEHDPFIT